MRKQPLSPRRDRPAAWHKLRAVEPNRSSGTRASRGMRVRAQPLPVARVGNPLTAGPGKLVVRLREPRLRARADLDWRGESGAEMPTSRLEYVILAVASVSGTRS